MQLVLGPPEGCAWSNSFCANARIFGLEPGGNMTKSLLLQTRSFRYSSRSAASPSALCPCTASLEPSWTKAVSGQKRRCASVARLPTFASTTTSTPARSSSAWVAVDVNSESPIRRIWRRAVNTPHSPHAGYQNLRRAGQAACPSFWFCSSRVTAVTSSASRLLKRVTEPRNSPLSLSSASLTKV